MKQIYSKLNPSLLLHVVLGQSDFSGRQEIISEQNFLQLATLELAKGQEFSAHRHIEKNVNFSKFYAQESWVVLSGEVEVFYFDINDLEIDRQTLHAGEVSITLQGGHGYKILENAKVLEFKTGPYFGREADKIFI